MEKLYKATYIQLFQPNLHPCDFGGQFGTQIDNLRQSDPETDLLQALVKLDQCHVLKLPLTLDISFKHSEIFHGRKSASLKNAPVLKFEQNYEELYALTED